MGYTLMHRFDAGSAQVGHKCSVGSVSRALVLTSLSAKAEKV